MSKFKVGDLVVRNDVDRYNKNGDNIDYRITNKNAGKMLVIQNNYAVAGQIKVKILKHKTNEIEIGSEFIVDEKQLDLFVPIKLTENSTELERWMVLLDE